MCVHVGCINPGMQEMARPSERQCIIVGKTPDWLSGDLGSGLRSAVTGCVILGKSFNFSGVWIS